MPTIVGCYNSIVYSSLKDFKCLNKNVRPKEKYASFPDTCPKFLGSVGRQAFFYIKKILYGKE